jgi:hypothetical protein
LDNEELTGKNSRKLRKALDEFETYVVINEALIPNYGERWRNEEERLHQAGQCSRRICAKSTLNLRERIMSKARG